MNTRPSVLIYRLGSLGDTIVALPIFNAILRRFPDHERIALTNFPISSKAAPLEDILGPGGFIHRAICYPLNTRSPRELWRVRREIRASGAKTLIYIGGGRGVLKAHRDVLFFRACGLRTIIGAPTSKALDKGRQEPDTGQLEHEARRLVHCLPQLGPFDLEDHASWDLRLTKAEQETALRALHPLGGAPFIAVNMGGKVEEKDWGEGNWIALLRKLSGEISASLVFVGGAEDFERAGRAVAAWAHPSLNLCGNLAPRESAAVVARASLFVGHDSGPLHLAWSAGVRCVCMYGSLNRPRQWHPLGRGHTVFHDLAGVANIPVADVADAVGGAWADVRRAHSEPGARPATARLG